MAALSADYADRGGAGGGGGGSE
eukprot:COSAG05_NODE_17575_length_323_cov_0.683036_1_plen_22_part_01